MVPRLRRQAYIHTNNIIVLEYNTARNRRALVIEHWYNVTRVCYNVTRVCYNVT